MNTASISDLLASAAELDMGAFERFYKELSLLRAKRKGQKLLPAKEASLIERINLKFPEEKWARLQFLDWKLESGQLTHAEEVESLALTSEYEEFYVKRVEALAALAALRQVSIDELAGQFNLNRPVPNA
jgi:uncharacterized membrane-anchored protein